MSETGLYPVKLKVSTTLLGAPTLYLNLLVFSPNGTVSGDAVITQGSTHPAQTVHVPQITGHIHEAGFGKNEKLISVSGQYVATVPPPAIGSYLANFTAALAVNEEWSGKGTYSYGGHTVPNATVAPENSK